MYTSCKTNFLCTLIGSKPFNTSSVSNPIEIDSLSESNHSNLLSDTIKFAKHNDYNNDDDDKNDVDDADDDDLANDNDNEKL